MPPRAEAALIAGSVVLWLALGGCGSPDQVIDLMPGGSAGTGGQPSGDKGGWSGATCESDRECGSSTPYCDRTIHQCVECTSNADCESGNQHGLCLTLGPDATNNEVAAALDAGVLSSFDLGNCVECIRDSDCPDQSWCTDAFSCRN